MDALLDPALVLAQLEDAAHELVAGQDRGGDDRLLDRDDPAGVGQAGRRVDLDHLAVGLQHAVAHRGRGDQQLEVELALEPLLDDLHVQEPQEAAAEAEAERGGGLGLVEEGRVVEPQLLERVAQLRVLVGVHRVEPGEHHRLDLLEAGERLLRRPALVDQGVADRDVGHPLDPRDHEAHLAGGERVDGHGLRGEDAELLHLVRPAARHEAHLHAGLEPPVHHVDEDHDAAVLVEPGVEDEAAEGAVGVALRGRDPLDDRLEDLVDPDAHLGRGRDRARGVDPDDVLDLLLGALGLGAGQVDLVQDRDDLEPRVRGEVRVREGLGLDPLARVHHQERPLAGGERARDLVGEVHVAGRVDEVEDVVLPVLRLVLEAHRVLLDRDARARARGPSSRGTARSSPAG